MIREPFPFQSHLSLAQADAVQRLRLTLSDDEVRIHAFTSCGAEFAERVSAFMLRTARPDRSAA